MDTKNFILLIYLKIWKLIFNNYSDITFISSLLKLEKLILLFNQKKFDTVVKQPHGLLYDEQMYN